MPPVTITAQGTSTIFRRAERAVIFVQVSSDGSSQEKVSKEVASAANDVRGMLKSLALKTEKGEATPDAAVTHWKNSTLSTSSYQPHSNQGTKVDRRYSARTSFEIKVRDFERLGSLATSLATMKHVTISKIDWRLTDQTRASLGCQSRQEAVKDAVLKAQDYAAVLMRGSPEAFEVLDGSGNNSYPVTIHQMRATGHGGGHFADQQEGEVLDFEPESVQLNSSVTVKFKAD